MHPYDNLTKADVARSNAGLGGTYVASAPNAVNSIAPPTGIATRVVELHRAVSELRSSASDLRSALGIDAKPTAQGTDPGSPVTLAEAITDCANTVANATSDLRAAINHLNS